MREAIPPLPQNTPSWRGAEVKHRDNFTFTFTFDYVTFRELGRFPSAGDCNYTDRSVTAFLTFLLMVGMDLFNPRPEALLKSCIVFVNTKAEHQKELNEVRISKRGWTQRAPIRISWTVGCVSAASPSTSRQSILPQLRLNTRENSHQTIIQYL
jgi:hypothetical protein